MYEPKWAGEIEGYSKNQIRKRIVWLEVIGFEFEDVLQELFIKFREVVLKYKVENPKHFMALYKVTVLNYFNTMSIKYREDKKYLTGEAFEHVTQNIQGSGNGSIRMVIEKAPEEVKQVLKLMLNTPLEMLEALGLSGTKKMGVRNNKLICKVLGYNHRKINLTEKVHTYLTI